MQPCLLSYSASCFGAALSSSDDRAKFSTVIILTRLFQQY
jgi:hypothetical protein